MGRAEGDGCSRAHCSLPGQCELVPALRGLLVCVGLCSPFPSQGAYSPSPASWQDVSMKSSEPGFSQDLGWIGATSLCSSHLAQLWTGFGAVPGLCACWGCQLWLCWGVSSCAQGWLFRLMPWWGADSKPLFLQRTAWKTILPMCKYPVLLPARSSGAILVPVPSWCSHSSAWEACAGQEELTVLLSSQGAHVSGSLLQLHQALQTTLW